MHRLLRVFVLAIMLSGTACETAVEKDFLSKQPDLFSELISSGEVRGSLTPFDLVENPVYRAIHEVDFLNDDEFVFVSKACGYLLVYPHRSMYVEFVNESSNGVYMGVSYCPITRSGICFDRLHGGDTLLLTASGYLFRNNLVPVDLHSGSLWSQMQFKGMTEKNQTEMLKTFPLIETTWETVRKNFPSALVYIVDSFHKSTKVSPDSPGTVFQREQPFGIPGLKEVKLFTLDMFPGEISLISTSSQEGGRVIVAGSSSHHFIVSFLTNYMMEPVEGLFPVIMKDETGTHWNIFGEAVSGIRGGEKLQSPVAYSAADWAWSEFFENVSFHPIASEPL